MKRLIETLERLGGSRPLDGSSVTVRVLLGLWWAALLLATFAFSGRTAKFVYIDF